MNELAGLVTKQEEELEKKNKITSGSITTAITVIVLLVFLLYHWEWPQPEKKAEEKAEVTVMMEADEAGGGGGGSPRNLEPVPAIKETHSAPQATEQTPDEDAVKVKKTPDKPVEEPKPTDNTLEQLKRNRESAKNNPVKNNTDDGDGTGQGSGDGSGKGPGKGSGDGGGEGSGHGPGIGAQHTFGKGRSFKPGAANKDCHEAGKVVLGVRLLPSGKIVFQEVDPRTTGSDCLINLAQDILKGSSFNASADPASDGTITFIFKIH